MKSFLREYWLWILVPFVLVAVGLTVFIVLASQDSSSSPFIYNVGG
jgi:hypothetical protein